jgi:endo-1,4-beta-D-glucanase Y/4-amino-4-deoxy-L-arabinose transferase-like glycosyltransferase
MRRLRLLLPSSARETFLVGVACLATALAHGINMFRYPYYENDEAVYLSQAWSVIHGQLAPYTYWYDHAPAGWIQLAPWLKLFGLYAFGSSIDGGRVAMLLLHIAAVILLFSIVQRLTGSPAAAFTAALILAVSPLGIYYMRRVLLDNIMLVWVLVSIQLVLAARERLWWIVGSAAALAVAVLTKETAVVFTPVVLALAFAYSPRWQRPFSIALWISSFGLLVSLYPLMAVLKGELFPTSSFGGGSSAHVSLLATLVWQVGRPGYGILDVQRSLFWHAFTNWWRLDPFLIAAGSIATLANLVLGLKRSACRWAALPSLVFWLYLLRGGLVLDFYITPLIPLLALNIGVLLHELASLGAQAARRFKPPQMRPRLVPALSGSIMLSLALAVPTLAGYGLVESGNLNVRWLYVADQTTIQNEATAALQSLPKGTVIAMDNYGYLDLHYPLTGNAQGNAHWYWKFDSDPQLKNGLIHANADAIDYILSTPQVSSDLNSGAAPLVSAALAQSKVIARWKQDGYGIELWQSRTPRHILDYSWQSYVKHFITPDGRVYDPQKANGTTSEGQGYALLRSVWQGDQSDFARVWAWTRANLQVRSDSLLAWRYGLRNNGTWGVLDTNTAADADEDTALALIFAGHVWNQPSYSKAGRAMIGDIWAKEVGIAAGKPYLLAGNWAASGKTLVINPSYQAPYAYRIFAATDPSHPWMSLVDTAYQLIDVDSRAAWNAKGAKYLPTEWVAIDRRSGRLLEADSITGGGSRWFSFGAARVAWRLGLDLQWNREPRAATALGRMNFLLDQYQQTGRIDATYGHDGSPIDKYESRAVIGAVLPAISMQSPKAGDKLYHDKLFEGFYKNGDNYFWSDPHNYYEQNWAWFGTGLYAGLLPDLWPVTQAAAPRKPAA